MDDVLNGVKLVMIHLANRRYKDLEVLTNAVRLTADEMASAIFEYGRTVIEPPNNAFESISMIEINDTNPPKWSVVMPLWTVEEGRSDLSIELTIWSNSGRLKIEIDNIHVL